MQWPRMPAKDGDPVGEVQARKDAQSPVSERACGMNFRTWKAIGGGKWMGGNAWKSHYDRNHWYLQFWIGNRHFVLSHGASR